MKIKCIVLCLCAWLFAAFPAVADLKLVCQMTDYSQGKMTGNYVPGGSDTRLDIKSHIPMNAKHLVQGDGATVEGTGDKGIVRNSGTMIQLNYAGHSKYFGPLKITYTYRFADKSMSVMILLQRWQHVNPVGPIRGHCTEYW